jgi:hypothetical protein
MSLKVDKDALPLTPQELIAARDEKIRKFPEIIRGEVDPPIPGQAWGIVSYTIHPRGTPRGLSCGKFKIRGSYPTEEQCNEKALQLLRDVDSDSAYLITPVGHWGPITDQHEEFCKDIQNVDLAKEINAEQERIKELSKEADSKKISELQEREKALKEDVRPRTRKEQVEENESLDHYTELMVKIESLRFHLENWKAMKKDMQKKLRNSLGEKDRLDAKHSTHKDEYMAKLNAAKEAAGIPLDAPLFRR